MESGQAGRLTELYRQKILERVYFSPEDEIQRRVLWPSLYDIASRLRAVAVSRLESIPGSQISEDSNVLELLVQGKDGENEWEISKTDPPRLVVSKGTWKMITRYESVLRELLLDREEALMDIEFEVLENLKKTVLLRFLFVSTSNEEEEEDDGDEDDEQEEDDMEIEYIKN